MITSQELTSTSHWFRVFEGDIVIGRARLYLIENNLHEKPYGYLEDVWVDEECRGKGIGTGLLTAVFKKAELIGCHKIVATSRNENESVHKLYERLGFKKYGYEFRMDLSQ